MVLPMSDTSQSLHLYASADGQVEEITGHRPAVLAAAFEKNPNHFKYKLSVPETLPKKVWINPPSTKSVLPTNPVG